MLFTSPSFILFLLVTFSRYCLPCFRLLQVLILVLSIFLFYGFGTPALLPLLLTSMPPQLRH